MFFFNSQIKSFLKLSLSAAAVFLFSVNVLAQAPQKTDPKYEAALETFYDLNFKQEKDIYGILTYYRRNTGKMDSKYAYMRTPQFASEAEKKFKDNWKTKARALLKPTDLHYLILFHKSALRKKLIELDAPMFQKEFLVPLFDSIPVKEAAAPAASPAPVKR